MNRLSTVEQRQRMRQHFAGSVCLSPANVWDPLSARIAERAGYTIGNLSGSVASHTILGSPDLMLLTLTELAEQIRRITRACSLSILVDADNGYGNALNARRAVEELEQAGASGIAIEDTLPAQFGNPNATRGLIPMDEMVGKLRAAVSARRDPTLMILGRTAGLRNGGIDVMVERAKAYEAAGVDGIVLVGTRRIEEVEAAHAAVKLPMVCGLPDPSITSEQLASLGVRLLQGGHLPLAAVLKALHDTYEYQFSGGARDGSGMSQQVASLAEIESFIDTDSYDDLTSEFLE
jgi:carboxyvinyl-carboxyphosphonate phosphorylmutase